MLAEKVTGGHDSGQGDEEEGKEKDRQGQVPRPAGGPGKREEREAGLTPAHRAELEHVSPDVDVVDAHQEEVEVEALDGHPGEAAEQRVVQGGGQGYARCPGHGGHGQGGAQQEGDVQEQHGGVQVHVDARQGVALLPVGGSLAVSSLRTSPRQHRPLGSQTHKDRDTGLLPCGLCPLERLTPLWGTRWERRRSAEQPRAGRPGTGAAGTW